MYKTAFLSSDTFYNYKKRILISCRQSQDFRYAYMPPKNSSEPLDQKFALKFYSFSYF